MQAVGIGIQPKDRIGAVDGGSGECFPAGIDAVIDLGATGGNGFNGTAHSNGVAIGASCLLEDNRAYGSDLDVCSYFNNAIRSQRTYSLIRPIPIQITHHPANFSACLCCR